MLVEFLIEGPPVSHQTRRRQRIRDYIAEVHAQAAMAYVEPQLYAGMVRVEITHFYDARAGDVDNIAKPILDGLKGSVLADDSQVIRAYRKLNRQRDAIPMLVQLSEASPDKEVMDDATFLLAECLIDIQAWNDAKTTLRSFIRRFPDSPFLNDARMALADISLKH